MGDPLLTKEALIPFVKMYSDKSDIGHDHFCKSVWFYCERDVSRFHKAEEIIIELLDLLTKNQESIIAFLSLKRKKARIAQVIGHDGLSLIAKKIFKQRFY